MDIKYLENKMKNYFFILSIALAMWLNVSCTKKNSINPVVTGQLYFHLHTNIDSLEVDSYNSVLQSTSGRNISLSLAQMYLSNIQLVRLDGSVYSVANQVILKVFENEAYLVGNVPAGNYRSVRFSVGLSAMENAKTPVAGDTVFYRPEMWFGNTAQPQGFVFLNVQGKIDTTALGNGTEDQMVQFTYKIGTAASLKQVVMPDQNFSVFPNQIEYVHMLINYMKIFDGIDLSKASNLSVQSTTDNSGSVATQIVNNIPGMFSYEK